MKKLLIIGIIALFIGLAFIPSFNAVSIKEETLVEEDRKEIYSTPKFVGFPTIHYKDYNDCKITETGFEGVSGRALLFPGYFKSNENYVEIKNGNGIIIDGGDEIYNENLVINGEQWNTIYWIFVIVMGFVGEIYHFTKFINHGRYFHINGYASFVRIYYTPPPET